MRLNHISISLRLTLWFASIFLIGWIAFGAMMWIELRHNLTQERYNTLTRRLDRLQALLQTSPEKNADERIQDFHDFAHATGNGLSEIYRADGRRYFPSPSASAKAFQWPTINARQTENFSQVNSLGQNYWVLVRSGQIGHQPVYLMAAAPATYNQQVIDGFSGALLASIPILLLVSSLGGYWLSRRAMRPVDRITATARSISIGNLSERLPESGSSDELRRLSETFNAMLTRLESAIGQIKRFTADASHELRGPLSFVRTVAEVALRNPALDAESRQSLEDIVEETAKSALMLENMLTLARADAEACEAVLTPTDLALILQSTCAKAHTLAQKSGLVLSSEIPSSASAWIAADEPMLRRLLWTLIDNAIKYTPAPGNIHIALCSDPETHTIEIRDTGVGISAEDLPLIFDRFYRADPSRSQTEGSGLGLSIARWITNLHGGALSVSSQLEHGTTVLLRLPRRTGTFCGTN